MLGVRACTCWNKGLYMRGVKALHAGSEDLYKYTCGGVRACTCGDEGLYMRVVGAVRARSEGLYMRHAVGEWAVDAGVRACRCGSEGFRCGK